jgi:hypothetical protein
MRNLGIIPQLIFFFTKSTVYLAHCKPFLSVHMIGLDYLLCTGTVQCIKKAAKNWSQFPL